MKKLVSMQGEEVGGRHCRREFVSLYEFSVFFDLRECPEKEGEDGEIIVMPREGIEHSEHGNQPEDTSDCLQ